MRKTLSTLLFMLAASAVLGHGPEVTFVENGGQWPDQVLYRALLPGGALFVERDALTYVVGGDPPPHYRTDKAQHPHAPPARFHAYRVHFEGSTGGLGRGLHRQPHYENHFIGNDSSRWASRLGVFGGVLLEGLLPGISLRLDGRHGLKYDLLVDPGADPAAVRMRFEGHDGLRVDQGGQLVVATSVGEVREQAPYSYQEFPAGRREVPSRFRLEGATVSFSLPQGHDGSLPLVIDPVLVFSTYSGSTANNFGFTATYDAGGHLYGGGIAFAPGYPTTLGALQPDYNGGTVDMAITKFGLDGSTLVWSTYIGGGQSEAPHSMVVNAADELFVMGTTGSPDYPVTAGCYDATFAGGPELNFLIGYGFEYANGVDLVVTRLSAGGDALLGSTYLGGSDNEGINNAPGLAFNYGDSFRGEIVLDAQERPVVGTCTRSSDMPTTPGAPQGTFGGGGQDGYLFRLDAGLTTLQWATFYGGSGADAVYGVQIASDGSIYAAGGTNSTDLPMAGTPFDGTANGGVDGFLLRVAPGGPWLATTYVGTPAFDQCYFVQLDPDELVVVLGQSEGNLPATPGKYAVPGSAQFIRKYGADLGSLVWTTVFGTGNGTVDISPSAFLVSDCGQIYVSGWGGTVNQNNSQADFSTTTGLEVTPDAFQSTTNGSDFYLMVLEPEAEALSYATFLGGGSSAEHVDGGTSRFDKNGTIYQAVCGGCFGNSDWPTTPGAWSATNNTATSCNLAVVKFGLGQNQAIVGIDGPDYVCLPDPAQFLNLSVGGNAWLWDLGDGTTTDANEPLHQYMEPGTYTVMLVLIDDSGCIPNDTAYMSLVVEDPFDAAIAPVDPICPGTSVQLVASGGHAYAWLPAPGLADTTVADPVVTPQGPLSLYTVVVTDSCGTDTATVEVAWLDTEGEAGPDVQICLGEDVTLFATGGGSYLWVPPNGLDDPTAAEPVASPDSTISYTVTITTVDGCELEAAQAVEVIDGPPEPVLADAVVCAGGSVQLQASGGTTYQWLPAPGMGQADVADPVVTPPQSMYYTVLVGNACATVADSLWVEVVQLVAQAWNDTTICPGEQALLQAAGGTFYTWQPATGLSDPEGSQTLAAPAVPTTYQVTVSDANGCADVASVTVGLHPDPWVGTGPDQYIPFGDVAQLQASGQGSFLWSPPDGLSCLECPDPTALPPTSTTYTVTLTDANGCTATATVSVFLEGTLFVPNTFTPNGDGVNDRFLVVATEVATFRLDIFNRWGELIHTTEDINQGWDGTCRGVDSPIDVYVWRVEVRDMQGAQRTLYGHVNLVR